MSESIEQVLKNNYDAFGRSNIDPLMSSLVDDVEGHVFGGSPLAGEYIGIGIDEHLSFYEGAAESPNVAKINDALKGEAMKK